MSLIDNGKPYVRIRAAEVIGGPQPGVAGADDHDIDVEVALERGPVARLSPALAPQNALRFVAFGAIGHGSMMPNRRVGAR